MLTHRPGSTCQHTQLRILATSFGPSLDMPQEGTGNAGCFGHTHGPVYKRKKYTSIKVTTGIASAPAFPAQRFTAYSVLFLVIGLFCHHHRRIFPRRLDISVEISEPHGFAVRFHMRSSRAREASIASRAQRSGRCATPLLEERGTREEMPVICTSSQAKCLRHIGTTGKSPCARKIMSSDKQMLADHVPRTRCGMQCRNAEPGPI